MAGGLHHKLPVPETAQGFYKYQQKSFWQNCRQGLLDYFSDGQTWAGMIGLELQRTTCSCMQHSKEAVTGHGRKVSEQSVKAMRLTERCRCSDASQQTCSHQACILAM